MSKRSSAAPQPPHHISGRLHVSGRSRFIGEEPRPSNLACVKVLASPFARARIRRFDAAVARSLPGVLAVLTHNDIPGQNQIGHPYPDEPLLPGAETAYAGQPVALVVAETALAAETALRKIEVDYEALEAVLTIEAALAKNMLYVPPRRIERGDFDVSYAGAPHRLEGEVRSGGQEHFYLETQRCLAMPLEDRGMLLYAATQSTAEVQEVAARVLGVTSKEITVEVPRLGGGFGGKERGANLWACLAALACHSTGRPVELRLSRSEDMRWTGKRHPFRSRYRVGFDGRGRILAYSVELCSNGGAFTDLSVAIMERAMLHADNAYHIPHVRIVGRACRTNLPPNTAMRGFGAPQGILAIETALERIARTLLLDPLQVRRVNAYREGQPTPYGQPVREAAARACLKRLADGAGYEKLRRENEAFNRRRAQRKRGLGVVPVKFGISFTTAFLNQGSALIWIYADGSVSLSHGGVEMGQEVNTKVAQVAARTLGVTLDRLRLESANTKRVGNASPTAASTGSDINGQAARDAALQLRRRLAPVAAAMLAEKTGRRVAPAQVNFADDQVWWRARPALCLGFSEVAHRAYIERVDLGAHGFYATRGLGFDREKGTGHPFHYFASGCGLVQAEVDLRSGHCRLLRVHIVHETAQSINAAIDRGQIHGAFFQGLGWCTGEEVVADDHGRYLAAGPSTYKIPCYRDLPDSFVVDMVTAPRRHAGVLGSKAIGEPPLVYGEAAYFAIKDAVESLADHRLDCGLALPATPEAVLLAVERMKHGKGTSFA